MSNNESVQTFHTEHYIQCMEMVTDLHSANKQEVPIITKSMDVV
jgi:hypothetical protein